MPQAYMIEMAVAVVKGEPMAFGHLIPGANYYTLVLEDNRLIAPELPMAALCIEKLSKTFCQHNHSIHAVANVDLDVDDGAFIVLVGPSGCGKSTTLRMLAGLETPTTGRIFLGGNDVTHADPRERDVAMVFQNYALYPHLTAFENMAFGLKMRNAPRDEITSRVRATAAWLRIDDLLDRRPATLSGGEQQRIALGRAIVRRPQLFLLDEPFANFDAAMRLTARTEIKRLHRDFKITTIHVTHDQEEALALADYLVVMREGQVQQIATPREVYARPANQFVGGFIGLPPMRFVAGTLRVNGAVTQVETPLGNFQIPLLDVSRRTANADRRVVLGFRVADCEFVQSDGPRVKQEADAPSSVVSAPAHVEIVEPLGDGFQLELRTESGMVFMSRVPDSISPVVGARGSIRFRVANAHLFAGAGFGERLN